MGGDLAGLWMLVILVAFSGLVAKVALPTLGAILIFAAIGSLRFGEIGHHPADRAPRRSR